MIVDNFKKVKLFLEFKEGEFYFLQILKRKKENPEQKGNSRVIKTYYIYNLDYFNAIEEEVKSLCHFFNARAYIGLNRRNSKKIALHMLKEITDLILNEQYESVKNAYNTCCGQYTTGDKIWIVDIDNKSATVVNNFIEAIKKCQSGYEQIILGTLETVNGWHLLTRPFNLKQLEPFLATNPADIHKNNPTLLYYNDIIKTLRNQFEKVKENHEIK